MEVLLENNVDGNEELIKFLKTIYKIDDLQDCYDCYIKFEDIERQGDESMVKFLNRWDMAAVKIKKHDCILPDKVLALKLLKAAKLDHTEH